MPYRNSIMSEFVVPDDPEVTTRLTGFYREIGWSAMPGADFDFLTYVHPIMPDEPPLTIPPTIAYCHTPNRKKWLPFVQHEDDTPSHYSRGLRLPALQQVVEVSLVVPSDETVHTIFDPAHLDLFRDYLYFDEAGQPTGVLKDQLRPLIRGLKERRVIQNMPGLGRGTNDLLEGLYAYLFPGQPLEDEQR